MKKNGIFYIVLLLFFMIFAWVAWTFYKAYEPKPVTFQGEIDAQTYNISSKIPGRISKIYVKKGDMVDVGDEIFSIYSPEIKAKLKQAQAAKQAANAQERQAQNGARVEQIKALREQYQKAKAAEDLLHATYKRIEKLYNDGVISKQKRDEVFTKYQASKHTTNAAYEMLKMAKKGARSEVKEAAKAQVRVYEGKLDEVNAYAKETKQYAFKSGEVAGVLVHEGELSPTGFPVVMLIDMNDSWARFSIREDYLRYFKKGDIKKLKIPALSDKLYDFRVTYISPQGEYATWKATQSGKGFDMKSFEVELRSVKPIKNLRVGMSVLYELKAN